MDDLLTKAWSGQREKSNADTSPATKVFAGQFCSLTRGKENFCAEIRARERERGKNRKETEFINEREKDTCILGAIS